MTGRYNGLMHPGFNHLFDETIIHGRAKVMVPISMPNAHLLSVYRGFQGKRNS